MTSRFRVDEVFDVPGRSGLIACGTVLSGELLGVPDFVDEATGERVRVLSVDFPTPRTRRTGQTILVVDRDDAGVVVAGRVWVSRQDI